MKAKEPAFAYESQNTMSSLRHQLITQIENTEDQKLLEQCLMLMKGHSMPCYFSEEELDAEIQQSLRSGNATESEVDSVFTRWMH